MTKQTLVFFVFLFLIAFFSSFGASAQAAEPAFDLINQVQGDLTQADTLLNEVERIGLKTSSSSELVVSVTEIRNKITLAQDFLNQAITAYESGNYNQALIDAKFARSNSELAIYYISSLLNRPSQFNINSLFLQGELLDLLNLRSSFTLNTISSRLAILFGNTSPNTNTQSTITTDVTGTNTSTVSTGNTIEQPLVDLFTACLDKNKLVCAENLKTCLASKTAPVSTCKLDFTEQQTKCDDLAKKTNTRLISCGTKRTDCLSEARNARASLICINNFDQCVDNAREQIDRDSRLAQSCQERVDQSVTKCEAVYTQKTVKFEQSVYGCFDKQNTCLVKAEATCRR